MRTYLVAYDLTRPHLNQCYLAEAIMSLGAAWARPLDSVWYVRFDGAETGIEGRLGRLLDENDGLIVQETRGEAVLANTSLRWFRPRRAAASVTDATVETMASTTTLVAFPGGNRSANPYTSPSNSDAAAA